MSIKTKEDIISFVKNHEEMMNVLHVVKKLQLKDWWIGAGFIRNPIWDVLSCKEIDLTIGDIDVAYFDENNIDEGYEEMLQKQCQSVMPHYERSITNQARMGKVNGVEPYTSTENALSRRPETVTSIGVRLDEYNNIELFAPWGLDDLLQGIIRPTPTFYQRPEEWEKRRSKKKYWHERWPHLKTVR